jgi:glycine cleavage system H lipoate-binding protein
MPHPIVPAGSQPCIWMSAGVLTYKLCDRNLDCERCPLDAGLRGVGPRSTPREALLAPARDARVFPDDRLYTSGHSWVQPIGTPGQRRMRFGLDAFAAAILGRCVEVSWHAPGRTVARGEALCQIDLGLGVLGVGSPFPCTVEEGNETLREEPGRLVTSPYARGWIVDVTALQPTEPEDLLTAGAAGQKARLDLRRFRRRAALQVFAEATEGGRTLQDGGEMLVDLRQMLGGPTYLELLRELIL